MAKGLSAHLINRYTHQNGSVWMEGFYDRSIRAEDDLCAIARYIVLNPVRAGLTKHCGNYPFWDAVWLE